MSTTPSPTTSKPRRRWLRFSLRTMLVLATCVALSWLGLKVRQAGEQRKAVEAIHRLGGIVFYDYPSLVAVAIVWFSVVALAVVRALSQ